MLDFNAPKGIRKYIGHISILIGVYGIISAVSTWFGFHSSMVYWNIFKVVSFQLFIPSLGNQMEIVFHLMLLTGGIQYIKSGLDRAGFLRFCYSTIFFSSLILFIINLFRLIHPVSDELNFVLDGGRALVLSLPFSLLLLYFTYKAIRNMESDLQPDLQINQNEADTHIIEVAATKSQRLIHLVLDFTIALALMNPFLYLIDEISPNVPPGLHSTVFISIMIFHRFVYWFTLEKIFQATPAKYLTGSRVVDVEGHRYPSTRTILHRTLCRFIPFEPLTFLGQNGLHDKLSDTKVVVQTNAKPGNTYGFIWMGCLVAIYIGHYSYHYFKAKNREDQITVFENHINETKRKDLLTNLSQDHIIVYTHEPETYITRLKAFSIERITADSVWGNSFNVPSHVTSKLNVLHSALQDSAKSGIRQIARSEIDSIYLNGKPGKFFAGDSLFSIKGIYTIDQPVLDRPSGSKSHHNDDGTRSVTWFIPVEQLQVTFISIENLEGDIVWTNTFPEEIAWDFASKEGKFYLNASNISDDKKYKALLTMQGIDGRSYAFFLEGIGGRICFYRKY